MGRAKMERWGLTPQSTKTTRRFSAGAPGQAVTICTPSVASSSWSQAPMRRGTERVWTERSPHMASKMPSLKEKEKFIDNQ